MDKQQMSQILYELRQELSENKQLDRHQIQVTTALADEIERKIMDPKNLLSGDEFLLVKLKESAEEFEENHPKLTHIIGRLSDLLARMGV